MKVTEVDSPTMTKDWIRGVTGRRGRASVPGRVGAIGLLLLIGMTGGACRYPMGTNVAILTFASTYSCPEDSLVTKAIVVQPLELFEREAPPPEVAADSERLRIFTKNADARMSRHEDLIVADIAGCGTQVTYLCWWEPDSQGGIYPMCRVVQLDDPRPVPFQGFPVKPGAWSMLRQRLDAPR